MSFRGYKDVIEEGDTVILFLGFDNMFQITIQKGKTHQTKYGALKHNAIIGKKYGYKFQCTKGFLYILHPTPELWTSNLPHRTQILYATDISMITLQLDLRPGSVVIESGTGSASLSHTILRSIAPNGYLHTFDFHEQRVQTATKEFQDHGFGDIVTVKHRDVCAEGFGLSRVADAVFLDLPAPWEALPSAKDALKKQGGRICSFSPCIEQVQRTCEKMSDMGFTDIQTMECLLRTLNVRKKTVPLPDLGFDWSVEMNKPGTSSDGKMSKLLPEIGELQLNTSMQPAWKQKLKTGRYAKKSKVDNNIKPEVDAANSPVSKDSNNEKDSDNDSADAEGKSDGKRKPMQAAKASGAMPWEKQNVLCDMATSLPIMTHPGHTGYLTFATLLSH